jgi:hypothetical protein
MTPDLLAASRKTSETCRKPPILDAKNATPRNQKNGAKSKNSLLKVGVHISA